MPLKLSLKPGEKLVINGAVITNGDRRATVVLQNKATVLREKDIMQREDAGTPARRIYFPIMMMYLDSGNVGDYYDEFALRMTEFMNAISDPHALAVCIAVSKDVMSGQYYQALHKCRQLFDFEDKRLNYVPSGVSADSAHHGEPAGH
ncbi:MAG: flagellar biosynthesis repressor FlbT [Alphaproteobacteria bacterium]|nr:flagellar biosynthesis repressor FlbT [Alphaproteobacteria bacterium]